MARKFNVDRVVTLYRQHEMMRVREELDSIDPDAPELRKELETKKFTVLETRDPHGAALALFNARYFYLLVQNFRLYFLSCPTIETED